MIWLLHASYLLSLTLCINDRVFMHSVHIHLCICIAEEVCSGYKKVCNSCNSQGAALCLAHLTSCVAWLWFAASQYGLWKYMHHLGCLKDVETCWNPLDHGMFTIHHLVEVFATVHSTKHNLCSKALHAFCVQSTMFIHDRSCFLPRKKKVHTCNEHQKPSMNVDHLAYLQHVYIYIYTVYTFIYRER